MIKILSRRITSALNAVLPNNGTKKTPYTLGNVPTFPGYMCLEVTNACNLRCEQCLYKGTTTDHYVGGAGIIDLELARKVIREAASYGCTLMLNGDGEPLLHPKYIEILRMAIDEGVPNPYFNTNGNKMGRAFVDELVTFFKGGVQISLDGLKAEHERIRIGSNYDLVSENIEYLRRRIKETGADITVTVSYCRYTQPEGELERFIEYWIDRVDTISTGIVYDKDYLVISGAEKKYDPQERIQCVIPWQTFIVRWNGIAVPCSNCFTKGYEGNFVLGNANTQSLLEIWNGELFKRWRQRHVDWEFDNTVCSKCDRWKMGAVYEDEIKDGMRIKHTGTFTTYSRIKEKNLP